MQIKYRHYIDKILFESKNGLKKLGSICNQSKAAQTIPLNDD